MKTALKWIAVTFGGLIALIFVGLIGIGMATEIGVIPSTAVQTGEELPEKQEAALREAKILDRKEKVKFYYSNGLFKVTDSGTIMTDKRILGYWTENDEIQILAYPLETIDRMVLNVEGGVIDDAEYAVAQRGDFETSLLLFLSIEEDRHLPMISALEAQIKKNNEAFEKANTDAVPTAVD